MKINFIRQKICLYLTILNQLFLYLQSQEIHNYYISCSDDITSTHEGIIQHQTDRENITFLDYEEISYSNSVNYNSLSTADKETLNIFFLTNDYNQVCKLNQITVVSSFKNVNILSLDVNDIDNTETQKKAIIDSEYQVYQKQDSLLIQNSLFDSNIGGTIYVQQFTQEYSGDIYIIDSYFIDGNNDQASVLYAKMLINIYIIGTQIIGNYSEYQGGAIVIENSKKLVIEDGEININMVLRGNGGALLLDSVQTIQIFNSYFKFNGSAFQEGGAIYIDNNYFPGMVLLFIKESTFIDNLANSGGAINMIGTYASIKDSYIINNSVEVIVPEYNKLAQGGGLNLKLDQLVIEGSTIKDNKSLNNYGGIVAQGASKIHIEKSFFQDNYAYLNGGGLTLIECTEVIILDTEFSGNISEKEDGGGLYIVNSESVTFNLVTFQKNTGFYGSGLYIYQSNNINFAKSKILENISISQGGLYFQESENISFNEDLFEQNNSEADGGAISFQNCNILKIVKGIFNNNKVKQNGAGIYIQNSDKVELDLCEFLGNISQNYGGAIYINSDNIDGETDFQVLNSNFIDNTAHQNGGGIYVRYIPKSLYQDTTFINNNSLYGSGGGLYCQNSHNLLIKKCTFDQNKAIEQKGGGLYFQNSFNLQIEENDFISNNASSGSSVMLLDSITIDIIKNTLKENKAKYQGILNIENSQNINILQTNFLQNIVEADGGGLYIRQSIDIDIQYCIIDKNIAKNKGGAIFLQDNINIFLNELDISENTVGDSGGGIYIIQSQLDIAQHILIKNSNLQKNTAQSDGGAIFTDNIDSIEFQNVQFNNNKALVFQGGALYLNNTDTLTINKSNFDYNSANIEGGSIYINYSNNIDVNKCTFNNNQASVNGGSILIEQFITAQFSDLEFNDNNSQQNGGSIYLKSGDLLELKKCTFQNNQSKDKGGAIYILNVDKSQIENNNFHNNICTSEESKGGAIYSENIVNFNIFDTFYDQNQAMMQGGALFLNNVKILNLTNTQFDQNNVSYDILQPIFEKNDIIQSQGGAIYYKTQNQQDQRRILTQDSQYQINVKNTSIMNSQASSGAGIMLFQEYDTYLESYFKQLKIQNSIGDVGSAIRILGNITSQQQENYKTPEILLINNKNTNQEYNQIVDEIQFGYVNNEQMLDNGEYKLCLKGTYLNPGGQYICQDCNENGICKGGYIPMVPKQNYWRDDVNSPELFYCSNNPGACKGNDTCQDGYKGLMCENCDIKNYKSSTNYSECTECDTSGNIVLRTIILSIMLFLLVKSTMKGIQQKIDQLLIKQVFHRIWGLLFLSESQLSAHIKIFVMHNQIISLTEDYQMELPKFYNLFSGFFGNPSIQLSQFMDCLIYENGEQEDIKNIGFQVNMVSYLIILIILLGLLFYTLIYLFLKKSSKSKVISNVISTLICFFIIMQPGLVLNALRFILCRTVGDYQYVIADTNIKCDDSYYLETVLPINIIFVILYGIIIPILILLILIKAQKQDNLQSSVFYQRAYGILYLENRPHKFYWEFVAMFQKLLIILTTNIFDAHVTVKGSLITIIIMLYAFACLKFKPYRQNNMNRSAIVASVIQIITILLGLCLYDVKDADFFLKKIAFIIIITINVLFFLYLFKIMLPDLFDQLFNCVFQFLKEKKCLQKNIQKKKIQKQKMAKLRWKILRASIRSYVNKFSGKKINENNFYNESKKYLATQKIMNILHSKTTKLYLPRIYSFNILYNSYYNLHDKPIDQDYLNKYIKQKNNIQKKKTPQKQKSKILDLKKSQKNLNLNSNQVCEISNNELIEKDQFQNSKRQEQQNENSNDISLNYSMNQVNENVSEKYKITYKNIKYLNQYQLKQNKITLDSGIKNQNNSEQNQINTNDNFIDNDQRQDIFNKSQKQMQEKQENV